ncbi:Ubiquitin-like domain superfamily [Sesbania bispinosa]|nr:Ubiquitin-like domain superfamily [Sesbania bispinosa]
MKKDAAVTPFGASSRLQFFVRMMPKGNSMVMQCSGEDTVKSVHERIEKMISIPVCQQRLIYEGKQLHWEQSLDECGIQNDANLQLIGHLRSGGCPQVWYDIEEIDSLICGLCRGEGAPEASKIVVDLNKYVINVNEYCVVQFFYAFMSSNIPSALVMLYVSPYEGNKDLADTVIRKFFSSCCASSSKELKFRSLSMVLEICRLLRHVVECFDSLYIACRGYFRILFEAAGDRCFDIRNFHQDMFPFVSELADCILRDLELSIFCPTGILPRGNHFQDFTVLLAPLRNEIRKRQALKGSVTDENCHEEHPLFEREADHIRIIYIKLLITMDDCLGALEHCLAEEEEEGYWGWSWYLSMLKELYHISKLYDGTEDMFWRVLMRRRSMLSLLVVWNAGRTNDHRWVLENKSVTKFESRRHLAMILFSDMRKDHGRLHHMLIDRSELLAESFRCIAMPKSLHADLFVEFKNEEATGAGVLREWFVLVCQAIFNPLNALFEACPNDCRRFFPNPASKVNPLHLEYFSFSGRIIALALKNKVQVDALGLTFVREVEEFGYRKVIELCPGGNTLVVNSKNREKYVDLLIQNRFVTSISEQVSHFAKGFCDILSNSSLQQFFQSLELEDLDWMLYGSEKAISVRDWRAHTEYIGYKETDCQISWFWKE